MRLGHLGQLLVRCAARGAACAPASLKLRHPLFHPSASQLFAAPSQAAAIPSATPVAPPAAPLAFSAPSAPATAPATTPTPKPSGPAPLRLLRSARHLPVLPANLHLLWHGPRQLWGLWERVPLAAPDHPGVAAGVQLWQLRLPVHHQPTACRDNLAGPLQPICNG